MTRIRWSLKVRIIVDYLCSKMKLPTRVGDRAIGYLLGLQLGRKADIPFPVLVYFVLKCIHLSESVYRWTEQKDIELDDEVVELASVLAERIHQYETPCQ